MRLSPSASRAVLGAFTAALVLLVGLGLLLRPTPLALNDAPPLLPAPVISAPQEPECLADASRREPQLGASAARAASAADTLDAAGLNALLATIRSATPQQRAKLLSSRSEYRHADLVQALLDAPGGDLKIPLIIDALAGETDPLVQAVLIEFLALHSHDERVIAVLDQCVHGLITDASRPVQAQLAVDGLLSALSMHARDPHDLFSLVNANSGNPEILRDLYAGLTMYRFEFGAVRDLVMQGLAHSDGMARFGAAESLRFFADRGAMTPEQFVTEFAPIVLAETDQQNRLLFLESLGAIGKAAAMPVLKDLLLDPATDARTLALAASTLAAHGDPAESLAYLEDFIAQGTAAQRRAAIAGLGALASPEAGAQLAALFLDASTSDADKLLALRSLVGKQGDHADAFLAAARSDDVAQRKMASEQFLLGDPADDSPESAAAIAQWLSDSVKTDANADVRSNALLALASRDPANATALLRERMGADAAPEVRGLAAGTLYLMGWARGDAGLRDQADAAISAESGLVQQMVRSQLAFLDGQTPDDMRARIAGQSKLWEFAASVSPTTAGGKDVSGMQRRFLTLMQSLLAQAG